MALVVAALSALSLMPAASAAERLLRVSDNGRFLVRTDGEPFFYLGEAAYFLFYNLTLEETDRYFRNRAAKGFTVIEAGLTRGMPQGVTIHGYTTFLPRADDPAKDDIARPNEKFFRYIDDVVALAERHGLFLAIAPIWDKLDATLEENTGYAYGEFLGRRYRGKPIIWMVSSDSDPKGNEHRLRALARGLVAGHGGTQLMTLKPRGGASSSRYFHGDDWLDFNMIQGSHQHFRPEGSARPALVARDYALQPAKPTMDSESGFENIPEGLTRRGQRSMWEKVPVQERLTQHHVRRVAYWTIFAGAHGFTYGANGVYQFSKPAIPHTMRWDPEMTWEQALELPAASQMRLLKALLFSRPYLSRVPDQSMIASSNGEREERIQATRSADGSYAMIYSAFGRSFSVQLDKISGPVRASWYDPATGEVRDAGRFANRGIHEFRPPKKSIGQDWVLVLDDASRNFPVPGEQR
jgi:hypothetical protein